MPIHTDDGDEVVEHPRRGVDALRRRCSVTSALSSPIRDAPARHHRPAASPPVRSATRRTTRRITKPEMRVMTTAPMTSARTTTTAGTHPVWSGLSPPERQVTVVHEASLATSEVTS